MRDPQGKIWLRIKKEKIKEFERLGICTCEMCYSQPPTFERTILDMAHSMKRRKITNEQEMAEVALLCRACHNMIEVLPPEEMYKIVTDIIKRREGIDSIYD